MMIMFAAACSKSEATSKKDVPSPAPASASAAAPAVDPMTVLEKSGDKLAEGAKPVRWHDVVIAAVAHGDGVLLRAYSAAGASDIGNELSSGDDLSFELGGGGAYVVFHSSSLVARVQEVGALFDLTYARVDWDAKTGKPVLGEVWTCDESATPDCKEPAWIGNTEAAPSAPPAPPAPSATMPVAAPSAADATAVVAKWLGAIAGGKGDAALPFMSDDVRIMINEDARAGACPESLRADAKTPAERAAAAQCVYDNHGTEVKILAKKAAKAHVYTSFDAISEGGEFINGDEDSAFLTAGAAPGSLAFVAVSTSISGVVAVVANTPAGARVVGAYVWAPIGD
jgi:hypothetical protein